MRTALHKYSLPENPDNRMIYDYSIRIIYANISKAQSARSKAQNRT